MLEITRELVEHYLRATRWEPSTLGFWTRRGRQVGTFDGMSAFDIDRLIEELATSERLPRSAVAFRLGLCAAAERDFAEEKAIGLASNQATEQSAARGISGIEHLRDAGIEYLAWESARKR